MKQYYAQPGYMHQVEMSISEDISVYQRMFRTTTKGSSVIFEIIENNRIVEEQTFLIEELFNSYPKILEALENLAKK